MIWLVPTRIYVVALGEKYGFNFTNKVMDEYIAQSMLTMANTGRKVARVLNQYLCAFFGRRLMAPEWKIFDALGEDEVPSEMTSKTLGNRGKVSFYREALEKACRGHLENKL